MDSSLSDLSQSDDEFKLFCWALNKSDNPFSVKIGKNETVDDLKKAIKKEKHAFDGIDYDNLHLWKLSSPIPSSEVGKKVRYARTLEEIGGCVILDPYTELSEYFSSPPPPRKHLHIIVQLPPLDYPTEDAQLRRFRLLCEKYWNKGEEGRREIYKNWTVQVPFMARPAEGAEEAATPSEGMVTDAKSLATGAQETIPVASASSGDTSEGSNFDTNRTVSYESLDLGRPDFSDFFGAGYSSILVRKEYRDMFQHISDLRKNGKRGVVVTGMPGIGKSIFLSFVLVERILDGKSTAYQCDATRVILILGRRDVLTFPTSVFLDPEGYPGTWALVDSNDSLVKPRGEFTSRNSTYYLVQAASPQPVRWKGWKKELSAAMAVMKPWSWEELYIGGTEFICPPLDPSALRDICVKYEGSARHCYTLAISPDNVTDWEEKIPSIFTRMPDLAIFERHIAGYEIDDGSQSVINTASQLITIIPNAKRQPRATVVSRYIAEHLFRALVKNHEKFWDYFNLFSSVSESRTAAGWLWELYALVTLSRRNTQTTISLSPIKPLSQPPKKKVCVTPDPITPDPIELPFLDVVTHGDENSLGGKLSSIIPSLSLNKSILFRPGAKNQATFDAFSISGDYQVTLYQATIRKDHSVKAKGLDFVWDALKLAEGQGTSDAERFLPNFGKIPRKWRLVFLIPEEAEKHWKIAQGIDFGGIKPKRGWEQYVEQFVGVLPKRTMTVADLMSYDSG